MNKYHIKIKDTSYEVEILDDPRQEEVQVKVNGETFTVHTEDVSQPAIAVAASEKASPTPIVATPVAAAAPAQAVAAGPGTIKSPLPGEVKSIKVQTGQQVKANDEICVIEAMKAMNIIRAPRDGTIARIYVNVGSSIAHGAPLMDIE